MTLQQILEYNFLNIGDFHLNLAQLIVATFIITLARLIMWVIQRVLRTYFQRKEVDRGRQYAFLQFVKYVVYTCLLYTSPSPRDQRGSRMPSSA